MIVVVNVVQVRHCPFIALPKTFAVVSTQLVSDMRMTVVAMVLDVLPMVTLKIMPGGSNPIMESLPLHIAKLLGRSVPTAMVHLLSNSKGWNCRGSCVGLARVREHH